MHPLKVRRDQLNRLTDLPNVGPAMARDLRLLGIDEPSQLRGKCPYTLHERLCTLIGTRVDPCVIDVFISIIRFMDGDSPQPWWFYTPERKARFSSAF